jgi:tRNA threonylcarbamoyladenosine biosynthesis protein TsaB
MIILTIRTDNPEAELGIYDGSKQLAYKTWHAHRALAETLHAAIRDELQQSQLDLKKVQGIVAYKGPGSFTGLRIGLTVANAISYGENTRRRPGGSRKRTPEG